MGVGGRLAGTPEGIDPSGLGALSTKCRLGIHEHKVRQRCAFGIAHDGMGPPKMEHRTAAVQPATLMNPSGENGVDRTKKRPSP